MLRRPRPGPWVRRRISQGLQPASRIYAATLFLAAVAATGLGLYFLSIRPAQERLQTLERVVEGTPGTPGRNGEPGKPGKAGLIKEIGKRGVRGPRGARGAPGRSGTVTVTRTLKPRVIRRQVIHQTTTVTKTVRPVTVVRPTRTVVKQTNQPVPGPRGAQGPRGATGATGATGPAGPSIMGPRGTTGAQGPPGPAGAQGPPGATLTGRQILALLCSTVRVPSVCH